MIERLCLGTAKFGMPWYGLGSRHRPTAEESGAIIERAYELGIRRFDCGAAYGDAEDLLQSHLGASDRNLAALGLTPHLITKLSPHLADRGWAFSRADRWATILLHNPTVEQMANCDLWDVLRKATPARIGASVYTVDEARMAIQAGATALQVPYCVLDQRHAATLGEASAAGITTYARQPFLQGLLTQGWTARSAMNQPGLWLKTQARIWRFWQICREFRVSPVEACLRFALDSSADFVVFGVGSMAHLEEVVEIAGHPKPKTAWPRYALRRTFAHCAAEVKSLWR